MNEFRAIVDRNLADVQAGDELWQKIQAEAARQRQMPERKPGIRWQKWIPAAALCAAAAVLLAVVLPLNRTAETPELTLTQSLTAGSGVSEAASPAEVSFSVKAGSVTDGLFAAEGEEGLILMDGRAYRLAEKLDGAVEPLCSLGRVTEYTRLPSLSDGKAVSSMVCVGTEVFAPAGMEGAIALIRTDNGWNLLQRVSFGGWALLPGETLESTLCSPESVVSVSWNGTTKTGTEAVELMRKLYACAEYEGPFCGGTDCILIGLNNGLTLRLYAGDGWVSCCGKWYCSDFFDEMKQ